jgi:hypothetical protein
MVAAGLLISVQLHSCRPALTAELGTSGFVLSLVVTGIIATYATTITLLPLVAGFSPAGTIRETVNRWAGFTIGAIQGGILSALVLSAVLILEPIAKHRLYYDSEARDHQMARVLAVKLVEYAKETNASAIGPTVAHYNLFRLLPPLEELQHDLLGLRNPLRRTPSKSEQAVKKHFAAR